MTGKTHAACSTAAVAVFALAHKTGINFFGADILPWIGVVAVPVGALLPDVDIPQSRLGTKFSFLSKNMKHRGITHTLLMPIVLAIATALMESPTTSIVACILVGWIIGMVYDVKGKGRGVKKILSWFMGKRGLIVTIILLILTRVVPETGASVMWGLCMGWWLHIFQDLFNYKGCPILWPVSKGHIHIASFKTRHWSEGLFFLLWTGGCALWALKIMGGL